MDRILVEHVNSILGPENYRTDSRECSVYSHDIGVMPPLVKPLIPAGKPDIVMRPKTEAQIVELLKLFGEQGVKLVIRAAATSGYGGALPQKHAAVLDMSGWQKVIEIDQENNQVRCQAGAIWEEVDRTLKHQGFELCLYPSSYMSSTVGGWLAQGGSGFGSFEYGQFKDNVTSARIILPTGEIRELTGSDLLDIVADAEGITGVISEVTFKIRPLETPAVHLISFSSAAEMSQALSAVYQAQLPLWSVSFLNPASVKLKKQLPLRSCHIYETQEIREEAEIEKKLPVSYLVLIAYPLSRATQVADRLNSIISQKGGVFLSETEAITEWKARLSPMRLKRLGPSIIPTEVIVPLEQLDQVLDEIDAKIHQSFILEGMVVSNGNVVLLGFIPHDERSVTFNAAFALALSVIKIANAHGGSGYSTGLYFRHESSRILGQDKIAFLKGFKESYDPKHIMNPGKVIATPGSGGNALGSLMRLATKIESLIRPIANAAKPGKRISPRERHGIPGDVALMATTCSRCGYCVHTCEQYSERGWESHSPRGKYIWIQDIYHGKEKWDKGSTSTLLLCTTCERCDFRCQLQLPVEQNWMSMRNNVVEGQKMGTFPPFEMMAASLLDEGDIWAGKREHRADWLSQDVAERLSEKADILFFAGCTASYVETDIAQGTLRLLLDSGYKVAYFGTDESCCGIPMKMAGKWSIFTEMYHRNVAAAKAAGVKTIVTACPACALVWRELYSEEAKRLGEPYDFEVRHYSELIAPAIENGTLKLKEDVLAGHTVTFHDSCHLGRAQGVYEPPRTMLKAIPGINYVEMEHNREEGICCGSVISLVGELPIASKLGCARLQEAIDAGADTVIAICPCCQVQLRDSAHKGELGLVIDDLSRVVATAAGYDIAPSVTYTTYMWGVFERFIVLMQPSEMARFMVALFPQMIAAMPMNMGGMMRALGKTGAGSALMRKMMPVMFPKMAPGILQKVMPDMVIEMGRYFGEMPKDMEEMMPGLLPKVMEELMPYYMPQLIVYLVPLFMDYLRTDGSTVTKN